MPCLVVFLALLVPRVVLVLIWAFSHYLSRVYHTVIWPVLGFFFMPLTTLAYAYAINTQGSVTGIYFVITLLAALCDLGALGGGSRAGRRSGRRRRR